jgi:hypothetical protein
MKAKKGKRPTDLASRAGAVTLNEETKAAADIATGQSYKIEARETFEVKDFGLRIGKYILKLVMIFMLYSAIFLFDHFLFLEVKWLTAAVVSRHEFLIRLFDYAEMALAIALSLFAVVHSGLSLFSQIKFDLAITRQLDRGAKDE